MADLSDVNSAQATKIVGSDSSGVEGTPVLSTTNGGLHVNLRNNSGTEIATTSNPAVIGGNVASGDTDSGNPIRTASKFNTTLPTYTDGQRAGQQSNNRGEVLFSSQGDYRNITGATTVTVKSGAGLLKRIIINKPTNGTATLYDNTAGSGTVIGTISYTNGTPPTYLEYGLNFTTGLTIVTTGANTDITVVYL